MARSNVDYTQVNNSMNLLIQNGANATSMITDALSKSLKQAVNSGMALPECYNVLQIIMSSPFVKNNLNMLTPFIDMFEKLPNDIKKAIGKID